MIKKISCMIAIAGMLYAAVSCKKQKTEIPPTKAHFTFLTSGAYFVTNDAGTVYKIPVGLTSASSKDETVEFTITSPSGAVEGQQYTVEKKSITIPAGKVVDTILVKGKFAGYPTGRKDTLSFKITGATAIPGSDKFDLYVQKYCPVSIAAFTGDYEAQDYYDGAPDGGPYIVELTPGTVTGSTGKLTLTGLWGGVPDPVNINLNWADPANFSTEVVTGLWLVHPTYGQSTIRPVGKGSFSSCDNAFVLEFEVTVAAGSFGHYTTTLRKL
jgi:hypothetical protein